MKEPPLTPGVRASFVSRRKNSPGQRSNGERASEQRQLGAITREIGEALFARQRSPPFVKEIERRCVNFPSH